MPKPECTCSPGLVLERGVQPPSLSTLKCFVSAPAAIRADMAFPGTCSAPSSQHISYCPQKLGFDDPSTAAFLQALEKEHHEVLLWAPEPPFPTRGLGRPVLPGDPGDCTKKNHSCSPCSSSYPSTLKLCGNKLLNGKECLQLSLQSTIKFPKSFYSTLKS